IEFGRLLDRNIYRLRPAQNFVHKLSGTPEQVRKVGSIGHQASCFDIFLDTVHRWQPRAKGESVNASQVGAHEGVSTYIKRLRTTPQGFKARRNILGSPDFECDRVKTDHASRIL